MHLHQIIQMSHRCTGQQIANDARDQYVQWLDSGSHPCLTTEGLTVPHILEYE
jgi:hypothetical protein